MNEFENITIDAALKRVRKYLKLLQEELAHRSSLDRAYISMLERKNLNLAVPALLESYIT
ncbi:helix-turn-helix domain-containing protein [Lysinibacillus sp. NPDC093692]|uniref:helix-turn-helix domain-containing protein n=1 Tax=Lysinibacillus sp. NPDC093692 TaxID=3390578 RepID=UPI003CFC9B0E